MYLSLFFLTERKFYGFYFLPSNRKFEKEMLLHSVANCVQLFVTLWTAACQAPLSSTISQSLFKFMSIELVMLSNHLILCHPLLLLPSIFPSIIVFSSESAGSLHQVPKYWSFSSSPSNEYSGLISFRTDWFDLAVQWPVKSLLQHHNSKTSIFPCIAFTVVQLSHPHVTSGKTIALTRWTFVGKTMSLLFNVPSRCVIAFLPRTKCLLISCLQSPSAVISEPRKLILSLFPWFSHLSAMSWWDWMPSS